MSYEEETYTHIDGFKPDIDTEEKYVIQLVKLTERVMTRYFDEDGLPKDDDDSDNEDINDYYYGFNNQQNVKIDLIP